MARGIPVPDAQEILALKTELQGLYKDDDAQIDAGRAVRQLKNKVVMPPGAAFFDLEVRVPDTADEGAQVAATLGLKPPRHRLNVGPNAPDPVQQNATKREYWRAGVLEECGKREDGPNTRWRVTDTCVNDGGAWGKALFTRDTWEERYAIKREELPEEAPQDAKDAARKRYLDETDDAAKRAGPPFAFLYADPRNVYPVFSSGKLSSMLEVSERPLFDTFRKYGLRPEGRTIVPGDIGPRMPADANLPSKVDFIEYWTETHCVYVIDGKGFDEPIAIPLKRDGGRKIEPYLEHGYGRVPYFPAWGFMMGHWANRKVGSGVAETKRWLVEYMSYLLTVHANVAARDAFTPVIHYLAESAPALTGMDPKKKDREEKVGLREVIREPFGGKWDAFPVRETAQALKEQIALIGDKIEKMRTPRVSAEIGGGLEGAGFAITRVLEEARIYHHPYVMGLEAFFLQVAEHFENLTARKVREKVWVFSAVIGANDYIGVGPEDLKTPVRGSVELDADSEAAKLIEGRYYAEQVKSGFMSEDQAAEAQGRNPEELRKGKAIDRMRKTPWYLAWEDAVTREEMGYGHLVLLTQQAQGVAQTGKFPNGQPVAPAMGTAEVPDLGQLAASPNQSMPDQAGGPGNGNQGLTTGPTVPEQSAAPGMGAQA